MKLGAKNKGIYQIFRTKEDLEFHDLCIKTIMMQQTLDAMVLAIKEEFGASPAKFARLQEAFNRKWKEFVDLGKEDVKNDKEIWYTKETIDRALKDAVGEELFKPWEERYKI